MDNFLVFMNTPPLILICGLPGSGKSTLARAFALQTGTLHLNSDILRRELSLTGHYLPEEKQKVYDTLLEKTGAALASGLPVVVDSTFYNDAIRRPFRELAAKYRAPIHWIEIKASEATLRRRLQVPRPDSEADFAVYEKIRDSSEPLTDPHLTLWSDEMTLDEMTAAMTDYLQQAPYPTLPYDK